MDPVSSLTPDPLPELLLGIVPVPEVPQGQEGTLDVLDPSLDDSLLLRIPGWTGIDAEAVALGVLAISPLDGGIVDTRLGDGALGVIDDNPRGNATEPGEGVSVTGQPGSDRLIPDKLGVLVPRPAQGHHEEPDLAQLPRAGIRQERSGAKVHLRGLPWGKDQSRSNLGGYSLPNPANQALDRRIAPRKAVLPHQGGVDGGSLNALGHPLGNALFVIP